MWLIYLWDLYMDDIFMWLIYEIHMCWNWFINVLKFKYLWFFSNINMVLEHRVWRSLVLCNNISLRKSWRVEKNIAAMKLIFVRPEDFLKSNSNFITWKVRVLNIIEEHQIDCYVSTVVEEPNTNEGKIKFKKDQEKSKHIIFDVVKYNIMSVIILLKTARDCFDTLTNIFKKKASSQEEGHIQSKFMCTKEDNIVLTVRMKKGINYFTTNKLFHSSE